MKIVDNRQRNYESVYHLDEGQYFLWGDKLYQKGSDQGSDREHSILCYDFGGGRMVRLAKHQQVEPLEEVEFHVK